MTIVAIEDQTPDPDEDYYCCALGKDGHEGPCAYVCDECNGTTYCWQCGGPSGDDLGTGCGNCDGTGYCFSCYEGMVTDE